MKIVKDTKVVKFPRAKGGVQSTFRRAQKMAQQESWNKIIIIGQGKSSGDTFHSIMTDNNFYGLIRIAELNHFADWQ